MELNPAFLPLITKFFQNNMSTAILTLEDMSENEAAGVIQALPRDLAVRVLKNLQVSYAATLLGKSEEAFLQRISPLLDSQFLTSVLMHLPSDLRERLRPNISGKIQAQVRELLEYPQGSVGRVMTPDFISFVETVLARDAIAKIRSLAKKRYPASYAYVVDEDNRLAGVLNMRDLMIASPKESLASILKKDVFSIHCFVDIQEAASELSKRKYFAAPVVDSDNHILGVIKVERLLKGVQEDTAEDLQKMFGAGGDERVFSSIFFSLRKRLLWLNVNLVTAFMAAGVVAIFESVIAKITVLAVFLPVVAGQGGNAGAQSLAVVMRGIVMREIPPNKRLSLVIKEGKLGAINGALIGLITAFIAWAWKGNPYLGVVIGLGMLVNLFSAGVSGAAIPLVMKQLGIDPAQSSSIVLTTVTDIVGFLSFLGFAVLFQNQLM